MEEIMDIKTKFNLGDIVEEKCTRRRDTWKLSGTVTKISTRIIFFILMPPYNQLVRATLLDSSLFGVLS